MGSALLDPHYLARSGPWYSPIASVPPLLDLESKDSLLLGGALSYAFILGTGQDPSGLFGEIIIKLFMSIVCMI